MFYHIQVLVEKFGSPALEPVENAHTHNDRQTDRRSHTHAIALSANPL